MSDTPVLVLGGTGKTGRRVVDRLRARDVPVRVGSRSAEPGFDWYEPATWAPAVRGVETAYVSFLPDLALPGAPASIEEFTDIAVAGGVRRLVLLSGRGEEEAQACEKVIENSGVAEWTVVRASWFNQNFSEGYMLESMLAGELALPGTHVRNVGEPFVDADDVADVAVEVLTRDGHAGQVYEVTGPRLLTFAEAVAEIAAASGRRIDYREVSATEFAADATAANVPAEIIGLAIYLFSTVLDGRNAHLTDGVQRALGREPRDFADFARAAAAASTWS